MDLYDDTPFFDYIESPELEHYYHEEDSMIEEEDDWETAGIFQLLRSFNTKEENEVIDRKKLWSTSTCINPSFVVEEKKDVKLTVDVNKPLELDKKTVVRRKVVGLKRKMIDEEKEDLVVVNEVNHIDTSIKSVGDILFDTSTAIQYIPVDGDLFTNTLPMKKMADGADRTLPTVKIEEEMNDWLKDIGSLECEEIDEEVATSDNDNEILNDLSDDNSDDDEAFLSTFDFDLSKIDLNGIDDLSEDLSEIHSEEPLPEASLCLSPTIGVKKQRMKYGNRGKYKKYVMTKPRKSGYKRGPYKKTLDRCTQFTNSSKCFLQRLGGFLGNNE